MEWVFSGIGTAIVVFFLGVVSSRIAARRKKIRQIQKGGDNAVQVQSGRDSRIES